MVSIIWPYAHEQWDHDISYENAVDWDEVQLRLKSKCFYSFCSMSLDDQMERIKQQLVEAIKMIKRDEEEKKKVEGDKIRNKNNS
jgi:hypothetical protein